MRRITGRGMNRGMAAALLVPLGAAAGTAAYFLSAHLHSAHPVAVTLAGCLGFGTANVEIPLELLGDEAGTPPVSFGPIDLPGAGGAVTLRFRSAGMPGSHGAGVVRIGDVVELPRTFGEAGLVPHRIDLRCRDGELRTVRYRRDHAVHEFSVAVRTEGSYLEKEIR
ncbi:hypothetical protein JL101_005635 [Skermanella rosea]|uniref:hypothetical protein n=1 Tax=Skermanella rosea TaxID=1817965 RepID=UPI001934B5B7|nr:hypothetical protein [Skermanella rosea]UEM04918.1 hypothetical protein JL101_005635 [Skermanella rosea]